MAQSQPLYTRPQMLLDPALRPLPEKIPARSPCGCHSQHRTASLDALDS